MNKPNNYDNVSTGGGFTPLIEGGHVLIIRSVEESKSKSGKQMIVITFDTAQDDIQPAYYEKLFELDKASRENPKYRGVKYVVVTEENGDSTKQFKAFCTAVEESNPGFEVKWGEGFCACFKGKRVGAVVGHVLDAFEGRKIEKNEVRFFRSVESAMNALIPNEYATPAYKEQFGGAPIVHEKDSFIEVSDSIADELPFT